MNLFHIKGQAFIGEGVAFEIEFVDFLSVLTLHGSIESIVVEVERSDNHLTVVVELHADVLGFLVDIPCESATIDLFSILSIVDFAAAAIDSRIIILVELEIGGVRLMAVASIGIIKVGGDGTLPLSP